MIKTLIYELNGKKHTYQCGPNTIQYDMDYAEIEQQFLYDFADADSFFLCGWEV